MSNLPKPSDLLLHGEPILMLDSIVEYKPGISLTAEKFLNPDNSFFKGHFPNNPIFPGVMLIESLFQTCGVFLRLERMNLKDNCNHETAKKEFIKKDVVEGRAIKVEKFYFRKEVFPNDKLEITVNIVQKIMNFGACKGVIKVNNQIVADGIVHVYINPD